VASEKNSTLVLPFPVELLRFLEASTGRAVEAAADPAAAEPPAAEIPPGPRPVSPEGRDEPAAG